MRSVRPLRTRPASSVLENVSGQVNQNIRLSRFSSLEAMVRQLSPALPVHAMHFDRLAEAARTFISHFPGPSYYAVKSNPSPLVIKQLYNSGIRHFDVASLGEVRLIRSLFPKAHLAFMNPVKSREAIRSAYFEYGVRDFVLDTEMELQKILTETRHAKDLTLIVRLVMPKGTAACALIDKFGCVEEEAVRLLRAAEGVAEKIGVSFHVGSQTLDPMSYAKAIEKAGAVVKAAGVQLDVLDVGGGFPVVGMGMAIPPLTEFFAVIKREVAKLKLPKTCKIWCEPGRALSARATTLVVRVELRKGDVLYINDGSYGNMFEIASMHWKNEAHMLRAENGKKLASKKLKLFRFYGPTCDSIDYMPGPFLLPEDIGEGDWVALETMGAYMAASRSQFNGFSEEIFVEIAESEPNSKSRNKQNRGHLRLVRPASARR